MNSIALLGQPNSGKSTVFNQLTGSHQHVGNWPGKTVERKDGTFTFNNTKYTITDLPGSYGLTGNSDEEKITVDYIKAGKADLVCILVDASQLERSMYMVADYAGMDVPVVLLLNMMDVATAQNKQVNAELLASRLGVRVLPFTAAESKGYKELKQIFAEELAAPKKLATTPEIVAGTADDAAALKAQSAKKFDWIRTVLEGVTTTKEAVYKLSRFDRVITSPVKGKFICLGIILAAFLVAMLICMPFMSIGGSIPGWLGGPIADLLYGWHVHPWLVSIFSMILPNVLYFAISMSSFIFGVNLVFGFLEEVGILARVAYQFDGLLSKLGLQGKAVAPMLMGFGCTIGGASGTRVMDNWGQRMLAMAVVWAIPCGSIWTIVPVISGMFFPWWGTILIVIGILLYVVFWMWVISKIFGKKLAPKESRTGMIMELPPYHKAHFGHILKEAALKALDLFLRALKTITIISLIFWVFSFSPSGNVADSLLYKIGNFIEPVTKFFGLSWESFMAFISSAFAKEGVLGVLNAVFVGQSNIAEVAFNASSATVDQATLAQVMSNAISPAEGLALIFAITFNIPCIMALATTYRESHSFKWTARVALIYVGGALILSCIVYHIAALFMPG